MSIKMRSATPTSCFQNGLFLNEFFLIVMNVHFHLDALRDTQLDEIIMHACMFSISCLVARGFNCVFASTNTKSSGLD